MFQKVVDETQMPKPQEYTYTFVLIKKLFLVGFRGLQSMSKPIERPCSTIPLEHKIYTIWGPLCIDFHG